MQETPQETLQVKKCPRFGTRLRHYVESHGLRLKWISKMTNMSYYRLYGIYSGASEPTVKEAYSLVEAGPRTHVREGEGGSRWIYRLSP